jgi:hypothetical protein
LDERSWRIDSCPSAAKGLYQHYRRYKALATDLGRGSFIGEDGFLRIDNVQIADAAGLKSLRSDLFRLSPRVPSAEETSP